MKNLPIGIQEFSKLIENNYQYITINELSDVTTSTGTDLTIEGGELLLESDATGTASFIDNGIVTYNSGGEATVERYLTEMKWHFIGMPVESEVAGVFHLSSGHSNIYLRTHIESINDWTDWIVPVGTPLALGRGYEVWVDNNGTGTDETIEFDGVLNAGDYTTGSGSPAFYDLEYTSGAGLNLICNPYPSALQANITTWSKTNIANSIWTWSDVFGNYVYWGSGSDYGGGNYGTMNGGVIPAMQGFFVEATGSNPLLTIPQNDRIHSSQAYYKDSGMPNTIRLDVEGNGYNDAIFVSFNPAATDVYDGEYDVRKLYGLDEAPQLYSIIPGDILSINSLPGLDEYRVVPLGFECDAPVEFTIEASEIESFEELISIYLEDIKEGELHNLTNNPSYTFTHEIGDDPNRFLLHFGEPNAIDEPGEQSVRIYSNEDVVYVHQPAGMNGEIVIYNMIGQEILRQKTGDETLSQIKVSTYGTGYYLVKVQTKEFLITEKIFIK
ncbi:MAG: T9SS type A sorting domain-containing protein [Bacteroidales bacterium]|nr:T9SS type A sorting domain-containing protein [Bacteroidales bacterium]